MLLSFFLLYFSCFVFFLPVISLCFYYFRLIFLVPLLHSSFILMPFVFLVCFVVCLHRFFFLFLLPSLPKKKKKGSLPPPPFLPSLIPFRHFFSTFSHSPSSLVFSPSFPVCSLCSLVFTVSFSSLLPPSFHLSYIPPSSLQILPSSPHPSTLSSTPPTPINTHTPLPSTLTHTPCQLLHLQQTHQESHYTSHPLNSSPRFSLRSPGEASSSAQTTITTTTADDDVT